MSLPLRLESLVFSIMVDVWIWQSTDGLQRYGRLYKGGQGRVR